MLRATIYLFGAISYLVSERKKELGIRVALGAQPWQLLEMILRQTLVIASSESRPESCWAWASACLCPVFEIGAVLLFR